MNLPERNVGKERARLPPILFGIRAGSLQKRKKHFYKSNPPSKPPAVGLATSLHLKGGA
jgi:hypothetical protein